MGPKNTPNPAGICVQAAPGALHLSRRSMAWLVEVLPSEVRQREDVRKESP